VKDLFIQPDPVAWMAVGVVLLFGAFVVLLVSQAKAYRGLPSGEEEQ
jgi:hypothetical protein